MVQQIFKESDGRNLKNINKWLNKENVCLQSIEDKQRFGKRPSKRRKKIDCNNNLND